MRSLRPTTVTALLLGAGLTALVTETIAIAEPSGDDTHELPSPPTTHARAKSHSEAASPPSAAPSRLPIPAYCGFGAPPCKYSWEFCCNNQQLEAVPMDWIGPNATLISLQYNRIATLPEGRTSPWLPSPFPLNLTVLNMRANRLTMLGRFGVGLTRLEQLELSMNLISAFTPGCFVGMKSLTVLYLVYNLLSAVGANTFDGLPAISNLDLSYNRITAIDVNAFQGHEGLVSLAMTSNKLTVILPGTVNTLTALQYLTLANNQLISIPLQLLMYNRVLRTVDLRYNRIARMPTVLANTNMPVLPSMNSSDFVPMLNSPPFALEFAGNVLRGCRLSANVHWGYVMCDADCAIGAGRAALPEINLNSSWECRRLGVVATPPATCRDAIERIGVALNGQGGDGTAYVGQQVQIPGIINPAQGCTRAALFENSGLDDPARIRFSLRFDDPDRALLCCPSIVISSDSVVNNSMMGTFICVKADGNPALAGRPVYQNKNGYFLFYHAAGNVTGNQTGPSVGGNWLVGRNYDGEATGLMSTGFNSAACPSLALEWQLFAGKWTSAYKISATCAAGGGGQSPTNPGPYVVADPDTGAISMLPALAADGHSFPHARLIATDATGTSTSVINWTMRVKAKVFDVSFQWSSAEVIRQPPAIFEADRTYAIAGINRSKWTDAVLFNDTQKGEVEFTVVVSEASTADAMVVTNCRDGTAFARISTLGTWTVELFARDSSAARVSLETWTVNVVPASAPDNTSNNDSDSSIVIIACSIGVFLGLVMILRSRWAKPTHTASDTGAARYRNFTPNDDDNDSGDISLTPLTSDYEDSNVKFDGFDGLHGHVWSHRT